MDLYIQPSQENVSCVKDDRIPTDMIPYDGSIPVL
jgi:hypothetical protein